MTKCLALHFILILHVYSDTLQNTSSIYIISPLQGSENNETVEVSWRVKQGAPESGTQDDVIIFVNGIKALSTQNYEGNVILQKLEAGAYRLEAMLATYDEIDGLVKVTSSYVVEFYVGRRHLSSSAGWQPRQFLRHFAVSVSSW
jgi:hypothetical protein